MNKNKCVYLHKTKDGFVFYVGSGNPCRPYRKDKRNNIWSEYAKNGYEVEIISNNLTTNESIDLEKLKINEYKSPANINSPSIVKNLNELYNLFNELFILVPDNSGIVWKNNTTNHKMKAGSIAGSLGKNGRWQVKVNSRLYLCHRIVYLLNHGTIDSSLVIDHINGNPSDNRIENLREVLPKINSLNTVKRDEMFNIDYYKGKQEYFVVRWNQDDKRVSKYFGITRKQNLETTKRLAIKFRDNLVDIGKLILRINDGFN